jgi:predicted RNA methylase
MTMKSTMQYALGQYMTPDDVADQMRSLIEAPPSTWFVFDPACGEGSLLRAAARRMRAAGISDISSRLAGLDVDPTMVKTARERLSTELGVSASEIQVELGDFVERSRQTLFSCRAWPGAEPTVILANPPYAKNREYLFFELAARHALPGSELVFLLPMAVMDRLEGAKSIPLNGRPLGVTTGHCIVHHRAGQPFRFRPVRAARENGSSFEVHVGVKLYEEGGGNPPQTPEILRTKPYSSEVPREGWLPCVRTGNIEPDGVRFDRLWVNYGPHLAHPKELGWFVGPRIFVRRVPIWATRRLGAVYLEKTALCAGDVLVVRHERNDRQLLRGMCTYLNSAEAAEAILQRRPSVRHRTSFPKISAKDLHMLFDVELPDEARLRLLGANGGWSAEVAI